MRIGLICICSRAIKSHFSIVLGMPNKHRASTLCVVIKHNLFTAKTIVTVTPFSKATFVPVDFALFVLLNSIQIYQLYCSK